MRWFYITFSALLVSAMVMENAIAGTWLNNCATSPARTVASLLPFQKACYVPASDTDDSVVLDLSNCENFDLFYHDDTDGDGTDNPSAVTASPRICPMGTVAGGAGNEFSCLNLDGQTLSSTNQEIYGAGAGPFYIDMTATSGTVSDGPIQIDIYCRGPKD